MEIITKKVSLKRDQLNRKVFMKHFKRGPIHKVNGVSIKKIIERCMKKHPNDLNDAFSLFCHTVPIEMQNAFWDRFLNPKLYE